MSYKKKAHSDCLAAGSGLVKAADAVEEKHSTDELMRNVWKVERFFQENPSLKDELDSFVEHNIICGRKFGIQEIVERWRWYRPVLSDGTDVKINNSWCPIMSRLIVEWHPRAADLIETRASLYDEVFEARSARRGA